MTKQFKLAAITFVAEQIPRIMPSLYAEWAIAMRNEAEALDDSDAALDFMFGCLWTCIIERVRNLDFRLNAGRYVLVGSMLLIAAITYNTSVTVFALHQPSGLLFIALATMYLGCASLGHFAGTKPLTKAASGSLALTVLTYITLQSDWTTKLGWINIDLYRALATESVFIWTAFAGGGCLLLILSPTNAANLSE